jgi:pimeloyl-ACP methyl ester carboxylesterase
MTHPPPTQYAQSGDISIAYQVSGDGPLDLILTPGHVSHLDVAWEEPSYARCLERLGSFARLIRFDKRGTGLSDREAGVPSLEQRMDDIRAVLDSACSGRAAILGVSEGGPMSVLFAATYPERTEALILYGTYARTAWAPDHPWRPQITDWETRDAEMRKNWGSPAHVRNDARELARTVDGE